MAQDWTDVERDRTGGGHEIPTGVFQRNAATFDDLPNETILTLQPSRVPTPRTPPSVNSGGQPRGYVPWTEGGQRTSEFKDRAEAVERILFDERGPVRAAASWALDLLGGGDLTGQERGFLLRLMRRHGAELEAAAGWPKEMRALFARAVVLAMQEADAASYDVQNAVFDRGVATALANLGLLGTGGDGGQQIDVGPTPEEIRQATEQAPEQQVSVAPSTPKVRQLMSEGKSREVAQKQVSNQALFSGTGRDAPRGAHASAGAPLTTPSDTSESTPQTPPSDAEEGLTVAQPADRSSWTVAPLTLESGERIAVERTPGTRTYTAVRTGENGERIAHPLDGEFDPMTVGAAVKALDAQGLLFAPDRVVVDVPAQQADQTPASQTEPDSVATVQNQIDTLTVWSDLQSLTTDYVDPQTGFLDQGALEIAQQRVFRGIPDGAPRPILAMARNGGDPGLDTPEQIMREYVRPEIARVLGPDASPDLVDQYVGAVIAQWQARGDLSEFPAFLAQIASGNDADVSWARLPDGANEPVDQTDRDATIPAQEENASPPSGSITTVWSDDIITRFPAPPEMDRLEAVIRNAGYGPLEWRDVAGALGIHPGGPLSSLRPDANVERIRSEIEATYGPEIAGTINLEVERSKGEYRSFHPRDVGVAIAIHTLKAEFHTREMIQGNLTREDVQALLGPNGPNFFEGLARRSPDGVPFAPVKRLMTTVNAHQSRREVVPPELTPEEREARTALAEALAEYGIESDETLRGAPDQPFLFRTDTRPVPQVFEEGLAPRYPEDPYGIGSSREALNYTIYQSSGRAVSHSTSGAGVVRYILTNNSRLDNLDGRTIYIVPNDNPTATPIGEMMDKDPSLAVYGMYDEVITQNPEGTPGAKVFGALRLRRTRDADSGVSKTSVEFVPNPNYDGPPPPGSRARRAAEDTDPPSTPPGGVDQR